MAKLEDIKPSESLNKKIEKFTNKINSEMHFKSELFGNDMSFEWVGEIDFACPYIDNIVRNPKVTLVTEQDIVILEKAKKTSVATVKHLSKNTGFIDEIDPETNDVTPSKLLIEFNEETFNTYENRVVYTLIDRLSRFVMKKEMLLEDLKIKDDKVLEYAATSIAGKEKVNIEFKMTANDMSKNNDKLEETIEEVRKKVARMREFLISWRRSEFYTSLEKKNVPFVIPPIKKNNVLLKNPNFQVAMKLWDFLQSYEEDEETSKDNLDTGGNNLLLGILDDSFLMNFIVMDSICVSKKEQKAKLSEYAVILINQQIQRIISLLLNNGIKITDQQLLDIVAGEMKKNKNKRTVDSADVKSKFKNELDEYLKNIGQYF